MWLGRAGTHFNEGETRGEGGSTPEDIFNRRGARAVQTLEGAQNILRDGVLLATYVRSTNRDITGACKARPDSCVSHRAQPHFQVLLPPTEQGSQSHDPLECSSPVHWCRPPSVSPLRCRKGAVRRGPAGAGVPRVSLLGHSFRVYHFYSTSMSHPSCGTGQS